VPLRGRAHDPARAPGGASEMKDETANGANGHAGRPLLSSGPQAASRFSSRPSRRRPLGEKRVNRMDRIDRKDRKERKDRLGPADPGILDRFPKGWSRGARARAQRLSPFRNASGSAARPAKRAGQDASDVRADARSPILLILSILLKKTWRFGGAKGECAPRVARPENRVDISSFAFVCLRGSSFCLAPVEARP